MLIASSARAAAAGYRLRPPPMHWRALLLPQRLRPQIGSSGRHPLRAALHPLNIIDLLSFAPSLLGGSPQVVLSGLGVDLRWFRIFRRVVATGLAANSSCGAPRAAGSWAPARPCTLALGPCRGW
jgi:hypothetical protein